MKIVELVQDDETPEEILFQKLFVEDKDLCPLMYSVQMCIFRVQGLFKDTVISCPSDIFVNFTASTNHCQPTF